MSCAHQKDAGRKVHVCARDEARGVKRRKNAYEQQPSAPSLSTVAAATQTNKQPSVPMAAQQSDGWIPMAVSRCPIDLHFVSLMAPVIAIIHLTVKGKKKRRGDVKRKGEKGGGWGGHTPSHSLALCCVRQTSHPTVSGGRQHMNRWLAPLHLATLCTRAFTLMLVHMPARHPQREHAWASHLPVCLCVPITLHDQSLECALRREPWTCLISQADQKHQRLAPLWPLRKWASYQHVSVQ